MRQRSPAPTSQRKDFASIVRLEGVQKFFGPVQALRDIDISIGRNEIVGLIGDNGAGKSTLIKVMTGVLEPTSGRIFIRDKEVNLADYSVRMAHDLSIETVYQDRSLAEKQPLWRNFFVGRQITNRFGFIDIKKEKEVADDILKRAIGFRGAGITVDSTVANLSGGERQGIAIGRAMHYNADLIILDEPTAALAVAEVRKVLDFVRRIKESGRACDLYRAQPRECARGRRPPDRARSRADRLGSPAQGDVGEGTDRISHRAPAQDLSARDNHGKNNIAIADPAHRGAADHPRLRAPARALHVSGAAGVPAAVHLHDLPLDAAAADPARRRPHLHHRRRRDRPLLPLDHRFFRLHLRSALQGVSARLARGDRRARLGRPRRLPQRRAHRQDRHSLLHGDAGDPVLLGRHGDRPFGRQVLRAPRRRGELGVAMDRRAPFRRHRRGHVDPATAYAVAVDGAHRHLSSGSSSIAIASASTRSSSAIRTPSRAWSASTSTARRSSCSR